MTQIISPDTALSSGLKSFACVDASFEKYLNYQADDALRYETDLNLYKVLLPVVRLAYGLPSDEVLDFPILEVSCFSLSIMNHEIIMTHLCI